MKYIDYIKSQFENDKTVKVTKRIPRKMRKKVVKIYNSNVKELVAYKMYKKPWDFAGIIKAK